MSPAWQACRVSEDGTHHMVHGSPAYETRFLEVLSFHPPGIAAVRDASGAYHIDVTGAATYARRFTRTFGYYEGRAAVEDAEGARHVDASGNDVNSARFVWCGNVQEGRATVRDAAGRYFHVDLEDRPVYEARWRYAGDFKEGRAVVQDDDGLHCHIDPVGKVLSARRFLDLDVFHKGFARARDDGGWFHLRKDGRPTYAQRFAAIEPYYNGQARCERFDGALVVIDESGRLSLEVRAPRRLSTGDWTRLGRFRISMDEVLRRRAWGTIRGALDETGRALVAKSTRASHDREWEALSAVQGLRAVPEVVGRERFGDSDWLFLERRPGTVLGTRNRCTPRTVQRAVEIVDQVLEVAAGLHAVGLVHTDLHPGNVLESSDTITVLDYEHAVRLDRDGGWAGELNWGVWEFVPPEQLSDFTTLDASADVYAAAVLLVYLLRGEVPFRFDVMATFRVGGWGAVRDRFVQVRSAPQLDGLDPELRALVESVLLVPRAERPSAVAFRTRLSEVAHVGR